MKQKQIQERIESEFRKYGNDTDINFAEMASKKIYEELKPTDKQKFELFCHIRDEHNLILIETEIQDILNILKLPK
jgi:hypothetical protein